MTLALAHQPKLNYAHGNYEGGIWQRRTAKKDRHVSSYSIPFVLFHLLKYFFYFVVVDYIELESLFSPLATNVP